MFLQASVILSTWGGVCLSACWDTTPPSRHPPGTRPPPGADTPLGPDPPGADNNPLPPGSRRQHTVNERPVRILLECILVINMSLKRKKLHTLTAFAMTLMTKSRFRPFPLHKQSRSKTALLKMLTEMVLFA